nr:MAG TPA: hypothetical protein [Caudoviricetes sp.]
MAQKRLKLFSGIVLRAYHISGSECKFRSKSKERAKNIDRTQVVGLLVEQKRDWLSSVPNNLYLQLYFILHLLLYFQ